MGQSKILLNFTLLWVLGYFCSSFAQDINVYGQLVNRTYLGNEDNNIGVRRAELFVLPDGIVNYSDDNGYFSIRIPAESNKERYLTVFHPDYTFKVIPLYMKNPSLGKINLHSFIDFRIESGLTSKNKTITITSTDSTILFVRVSELLPAINISQGSFNFQVPESIYKGLPDSIYIVSYKEKHTPIVNNISKAQNLFISPELDLVNLNLFESKIEALLKTNNLLINEINDEKRNSQALKDLIDSLNKNNLLIVKYLSEIQPKLLAHFEKKLAINEAKLEADGKYYQKLLAYTAEEYQHLLQQLETQHYSTNSPEMNTDPPKIGLFGGLSFLNANNIAAKPNLGAYIGINNDKNISFSIGYQNLQFDEDKNHFANNPSYTFSLKYTYPELLGIDFGYFGLGIKYMTNFSSNHLFFGKTDIEENDPLGFCLDGGVILLKSKLNVGVQLDYFWITNQTTANYMFQVLFYSHFRFKDFTM